MRKISCPICGRENIAEETDRCPQCDADLESFRILESLPDNTVPAQKSGSWLYLLVLIVAGLLILLNVYQYFRLKGLERKVSDQEILVSDSVSRMAGRIENLAETTEKAVALIEKKTDEASANIVETIADPAPETEFFTYESTDTDTLWDVSRRYYGSGIYYPVLLEHNPHVFVHRVGRGVRLKVLADACLAPDVYEKTVSRDRDGTYWHYTVQAGDTFESVAKKFCKKGDTETIEILKTDNSGPFPDPGKKLRIRLR